MILRLVWRSLARRPGRSALLLAGYALGVGVTVALLSIGSALLEQSRDRELVGGGDLTVLPAGLDLETFKTGGVSSLYFTIEQAPFLYRQVLDGPRFEDRITAAAPWIDDELVYVGEGDGEASRSGESDDGRVDGGDDGAGGGLVAASAGGRIPALSQALGVGTEPVSGRWVDSPSDRQWRAPGDSALYAGLDAFHLPADAAAGDSTWAEWHYFNVLLPEGRGWLYLTYMVAGAVPDGRWGGRLLATLVEPADGGGAGAPPRGSMRARQFEAEVPDDRVSFSLARPDLRIGNARVALDGGGVYHLSATVPPAADGGGPDLRVELRVRAASRQHLPPLEVAGGDFTSGYTAPLLDGRASGSLCVGGRCREVRSARAYHDHNWGVWRAVTWDWGHAHLGARSLLYGGVRRDTALASAAPGAGEDGGSPGRDARGTIPGGGGRFLFLSDTLGFLGLFSIDSLSHRWPDAAPALASPRSLRLRASRPPDSVRLDAEVRHARVTEAYAAGGGARALFHQMQGTARLRARLGERTVADRGPGFFETWRIPADSVPARP